MFTNQPETNIKGIALVRTMHELYYSASQNIISIDT